MSLGFDMQAKVLGDATETARMYLKCTFDLFKSNYSLLVMMVFENKEYKSTSSAIANLHGKDIIE